MINGRIFSYKEQFKLRDTIVSRVVITPQEDDTKIKISINEILDKVENGDTSILDKIGVAYTEIEMPNGKKKISFEYEGARYTVYLAENNEKDKITDDSSSQIVNTRVQNYSDGSYSVYESDTNGRDLRRLDYSKDGKLEGTLEFTYNDDGTTIQTSKNAAGKTTQITYLDANNFVTENFFYNDDGSYCHVKYANDGEKVISRAEYNAAGVINEYHEYNENDEKIIYFSNGVKTSEITLNKDYSYQVYYDEQGNIKDTLETFKNENGTETSIIKDANGNVVSYWQTDAMHNIVYEEIYENGKLVSTREYEYPNENSSQMIERDINGNITSISFIENDGTDSRKEKVYTKDDEKFVDVLKELIDQYKGSIDSLRDMKINLQMPRVPNASDYVLTTTGKIDEAAYNNACAKYEMQMADYQNNLAIIYNEFAMFEEKLNNLESQLADITRTQEITDVENMLSGMANSINGETSSLLNTKLEEIKQDENELWTQKEELNAQLSEIRKNISALSTTFPQRPPNALDYVLTATGKVDEEAYAKAMAEYEAALSECEKQLTEYYHQESAIIFKINFINIQLDQNLDELSTLKENTNAVCTLQNLIDSLDDSPSSQNTRDKLQQMMDELTTNIKYQHKLEERSEQRLRESWSIEIPTPPSARDYTNNDGIVDEREYAIAYNNYEKEQADYDNEQRKFNSESLRDSESLSRLSMQVDTIVFNAIFTMIDNKIVQLKENGDIQDAKEMQEKSNNLRHNFNITKKQLKTLKSRQNNLLKRLNNLSWPVPPSTIDFTNSITGEINEKAYEKARRHYERQCEKYDRITDKINSQVEEISVKISDLEAKMTNIKEELQSLL